MVSHKHKCIFVHVPKAAGTSVERAFMEDLGLDMDNRHALLLGASTNTTVGPRRVSHLTAAEYVDLHFVSQEIFDAYFKFAFVRNPIDRLYSTYKYKRFIDYLSFDDFIKLKLENFIKSETEGFFFKPQYEYLYGNNQLLVDFVGKLERLEKDFEFIQKKLNSKLTLNHYNKSLEINGFSKIIRRYGKLVKDREVWGKAKYNENGKKLSEEAIAIIENYYKVDFDAFEYMRPKATINKTI